MKTLLSIISWILGSILLLFGIFLTSDVGIEGLGLVAAGLLLLPLVRKLFYSKVKIKIHLLIRAILVTVLALVSMSLVAEKTHVSEFEKNGSQIISSIETLINDGQYKEALSKAQLYEAAGDDRIAKLRFEAEKKYDAKRADELEKQNEIKAKQAVLDKALEEKQAAQKVIDDRVKMIKSQFSAWDGAHRNLERLIKKGLRDPDSYQHNETRYSDENNHLKVFMTYRAKNGFGGMSFGSVVAKVGLDGEILQIIESE